MVPAPLGMRLLTYTFVALVVPLAAVTRGRPGAGRALWAAALATFAVSALHLSQLHRGDASWPVELVGHHASLPLAFAILYQDYRFALADLFLKRAAGAARDRRRRVRGDRDVRRPICRLRAVRPGRSETDDRPGHACGSPTALVYPVLRRVTAWFVDTIVLHRPDYPSLRAAIARASQSSDDVPDAALAMVCDGSGLR